MSNSSLDFLNQKLFCPHCNTQLSLCHSPPVHVGDGLGWGSEYLFICLNNDCSLFANGWKNIENNYGHVGSYRYMRLPDSNEEYNMMVAGKDAFTGSVVDPEAIKNQNVRYQKQKDAIAGLDDCVEKKDLTPVLYLLLDNHAALSDRERAAGCLEPINSPDCIEPLRNHEFRDSNLEQTINMAISSVLSANFLKECPYCKELIKKRADLCKHCNKKME
ncbi:MAG: zinc ribbon domain-containing protein [Desulfobulbaceae bacterium]|nr:zinc ribbon domain-containing protein [Desulfobulbaceae bacterium]